MPFNKKRRNLVVLFLFLLVALILFQNCGDVRIRGLDQPPILFTSVTPTTMPQSTVTTTTGMVSNIGPCGQNVCMSGDRPPSTPSQSGLAFTGGCGGGAAWMVNWDWLGIPGTQQGFFAGTATILQVCQNTYQPIDHGGGAYFQNAQNQSFYSNIIYDGGIQRITSHTEMSRQIHPQFIRIPNAQEVRILASEAYLTGQNYAPVAYKFITQAGLPRAVVAHKLDSCNSDSADCYHVAKRLTNAVPIGDKVILLYQDPLNSGLDYYAGKNQVYRYDFTSGFAFIGDLSRNDIPHGGTQQPKVYPLWGIQDYLIAGVILNPETSTQGPRTAIKVFKIKESPLSLEEKATLYETPDDRQMQSFVTWKSSYSADPSGNRFAMCKPPGLTCDTYQVSPTGITLEYTYGANDLPPPMGASSSEDNSQYEGIRQMKIAGPYTIDYIVGSNAFRVFKNGQFQSIGQLPVVGEVQGAAGILNSTACLVGYYTGPGTCVDAFVDGVTTTYRTSRIGSIAIDNNNELSVSTQQGFIIRMRIY